MKEAIMVIGFTFFGVFCLISLGFGLVAGSDEYNKVSKTCTYTTLIGKYNIFYRAGCELSKERDVVIPSQCQFTGEEGKLIKKKCTVILPGEEV